MNDSEMTDAFRALAARDAAMTPPYSHAPIDVMRLVVRARRRAWAAASGLAFVAAAMVMFVVVPRTGELDLDLSNTKWTSSTDFLLETPGRYLLRTVPAIRISTNAPSANASTPRDDTSGRKQ